MCFPSPSGTNVSYGVAGAPFGSRVCGAQELARGPGKLMVPVLWVDFLLEVAPLRDDRLGCRVSV